MRIALLSPAGAMHRYTGNFKKSLHYAPLTLTLLAALIPDGLDAEVEVYDETVEDIPKDLDVDLIGITVITGTSVRSYKWAQYYRSKGVTVVLGGVHPTLLPGEAGQYADAVVVGHAEKSWPRLLKDFQTGKLKKIYRPTDQLSLKEQPTPSRNLLDKSKFITANSIEATRGCYNECSFCAVSATFGQQHHKRPVRQVIEEIEQLPGKVVLFVDVNLTADREYARELFREMAPLNKWWFGLTTVDIINDDQLFELMVESGCKGLLIGFESVSQYSLGNINKLHNQNIDYKELMKKIHSAGILVNGTFCLGMDTDDKSTFEKTVESIIDLKIDLPRFSIVTPFPNTPLYRNFKDEGRIIEKNWAMYDVQHCVFQPKNMSPEELEEGLIWTWEKTYSLPSITKRVSRFHKLIPINLMTNFGYRFYGKKLREFPREVMVDNSDIPGDEIPLSSLRK